MSYRFDISGAFERVPHSKKIDAYKEVMGVESDRTAVQNASNWRKNPNLKLSATQIKTICRVCGISLDEFFVED